MRKGYVFFLVVLLAAWPAKARAAISVLDWLEALSGPGPSHGVVFSGRVFCVDQGEVVPWCLNDVTNRNGQPRDVSSFLLIDVGFYSTGNNPRFDDTPTDTRPVHTFRLEPVYMFRLHAMLDLGMGAGLIRFSGDGFDSLTRATLTPLRMTFFPLGFLPRAGTGRWWGHFLRVEFAERFVTKGLNGADFGSPSTYSTGGEFNTSLGVGVDFGVLLR
jgi:hypothetical protein